MKLFHHSHQPQFRTPFGAVPVDTTVTLALETFPATTHANLHVIVDGAPEVVYESWAEEAVTTHSWEIFQPQAGLVWYYFSVDGGVYYGNNFANLGGEGAQYDHLPPAFQITFYRARAIPEWYKKGVLYQIFPDRFARGDHWQERLSIAMREENRGGPRRFIHQDWNDRPFYPKNARGEVTRWGFFGGTLLGIVGKLNHLKGLGVTTLYLNPIFMGASNHKYDTADYLKLDPAFGTEEDFVTLCQQAEALDIHIILDGVFSHTGADSIYFNQFGNYPGEGATQGTQSPYYDWYQFTQFPHKYDSWWGVGDLPNVKEMTPSYLAYMFGENGVIRHWIRLGAKGWRLDVADELPDEFIQQLRAAARAQRPDALILGEVWEDASNKESYGVRRQYLLGDELDCTMNYPFRQGMLAFGLGELSAKDLGRTLLSLKENYPPDHFYGAMNLLGTHDTERVLTMLGRGEAPTTDLEREWFSLTADQRSLAKKRLKMLVTVQMTSPGVPAIYYGDEAGMEGLADPFNRGTYPWGSEDKALLRHYRSVTHLRTVYPVLVEGDYIPCSPTEQVYAFWRKGGDQSILVVANRGSDQVTLTFPVADAAYGVDLLTGQPQNVDQNKLTLTLAPITTSVIYVGQSALPPLSMPRGAGVLCHLTSLPNLEGGLLPAAKAMVDKLVESGQKYWQILPLNPVDDMGSPYSTTSVFAGNDSLLGDIPLEFGVEYEEFCAQSAHWLEDYALFRVLKAVHKNAPWQRWPAPHRNRSDISALQVEYATEIGAVKSRQFIFWRTWEEIRRYVNQAGVKIIGDLPIYVAEDSADVWAAPHLFALDEAGYTQLSAGVPPDYFSQDGQSWGNPLYCWEEMAGDQFQWWQRRMAHAMGYHDYVRLDHFRSFAAYYGIPKGKSATEGYWSRGWGHALFAHLTQQLGPLPIVAEDLGALDGAVYELLQYTGFPGMNIYQFSKGEMSEMTTEQGKSRLFYSGSHDNQTLVSWLQDTNQKESAKEAVEWLYASHGNVVILPLQDILGLDDGARMNTPGVSQGNWGWHCPQDGLNAPEWTWLAELAKEHKRAEDGSNDLL